MKKHESFSDLWAEIEDDEAYWAEKNKLDFSVELFQIMKRRGISKKELAERLGTSQAYITKVFRGDANFTLDSMTKLVQALDAKIAIQIVPKEENVRRWYKVLNTRQGKRPIPSQNWYVKKPRVERESFSENAMEACLG